MSATPYESSTVLVITKRGMGKGDPELQIALLSKYLNLLMESDLLPAAICFYTEGVHLVIEGSPVLDELRHLDSKGVRLIVCSTCLHYYGLIEKLAIGIVGGMTDIIEAQWRASKVVNL